MTHLDVIGLAAGACTTISFLPQLIKTWKSKSAKDVSLGMFVLSVVGVALWLIYGILEHSLPLIAANTITLGFGIVILAMKIRFG